MPNQDIKSSKYRMANARTCKICYNKQVRLAKGSKVLKEITTVNNVTSKI